MTRYRFSNSDIHKNSSKIEVLYTKSQKKSSPAVIFRQNSRKRSLIRQFSTGNSFFLAESFSKKRTENLDVSPLPVLLYKKAIRKTVIRIYIINKGKKK